MGYGYTLEESTLEEMAYILGFNIRATKNHLERLHRAKKIILDRYISVNRPTEKFFYLLSDDIAYQCYLDWKESKARLQENRRIRRNRRNFRKIMEKRELEEKLKNSVV